MSDEDDDRNQKMFVEAVTQPPLDLTTITPTTTRSASQPTQAVEIEGIITTATESTVCEMIVSGTPSEGREDDMTSDKKHQSLHLT